MKALARYLMAGVGLVIAAGATSCQKRTPHVISDTGVVKCEVTKTEFGHITGLRVQQRIGTNTYQELYVFDPARQMDDKEAASFASRSRFSAEGLRETWIGRNGKWETVVLKLLHPAGGEYFVVMQNPPNPNQVGDILAFGSILTTDPSKVLHKEAEALLTDGARAVQNRDEGSTTNNGPSGHLPRSPYAGWPVGSGSNLEK